ncbi:hypothetical protein [Pedosphaera parvula]|uniref:ABC-2 type transporter n=1 Tax=Pedosphaera parvula (strain Ellin514) TaxID=320771 RepID=B9XQI2_PEDPL|nr:hypothetical protein [Pedosphaera parvula]EEF57907.1 hypothetical protein Cflav_PD0857 [Pedosphaera parvula Ellin514]
MTFLPIVERELRVVARRPGTYRKRALVAAFLAVIVLAEILLLPFVTTSVSLGRALYIIVSCLALVLCALSGIWSTADSLSGEKREGTLGLLFLTDLNGYDVVLGKLAAALLASIYSLLAILPILSWSLLLGGMTMGEIWRMGFALVNVLFFSLAVGVWVSSRSHSVSSAMGGTFFLVMLFLLAPVPFKASHFAPLSPAYAFFAAPIFSYAAHPFYYWESLLLTQAFIACFLADASRTIKLFREGELFGSASTSPKATSSASVSNPKYSEQRAKIRALLLDHNPISWLASHNISTPRLVWLLVFFAGLIIALIFAFPLFYSLLTKPQLMTTAQSNTYTVRITPIQTFMSFMAGFGFVGLLILINAAVKVLVASQACRCHAEARRNSTLEILLTTPIKVQDILQGQVLALKRTFLKPILVLLAFEVTGVYAALYQAFGQAATGELGHRFGDTVLFVEAAFILFFLLDFQGVTWAGIWFGLCSKNESQATFKTTFYVIVGPMLLLVLYFIGAALFLAWPVVSFVRARLKLQEHFRYLAGQRLTSGAETSLWLPLQIPEAPEEPSANPPPHSPFPNSTMTGAEKASFH